MVQYAHTGQNEALLNESPASYVTRPFDQSLRFNFSLHFLMMLIIQFAMQELSKAIYRQVQTYLSTSAMQCGGAQELFMRNLKYLMNKYIAFTYLFDTHNSHPLVSGRGVLLYLLYCLLCNFLLCSIMQKSRITLLFNETKKGFCTDFQFFYRSSSIDQCQVKCFNPIQIGWKKILALTLSRSNKLTYVR